MLGTPGYDFGTPLALRAIPTLSSYTEILTSSNGLVLTEAYTFAGSVQYIIAI